MTRVLDGFDTLDALGTFLGAFVTLASLATLVGMPWQYTGGAGVMVGQVLGSVLAVVLGVSLVVLSLRY